MITLENEINEFVSAYRPENHEQAKIRANNLIKKFPQETKLLKTIGIIFVQNNKIEDGISIFEKVLKIEPSSGDTLINIGIAYFELNKLDLSLQYLKKAEKASLRKSEIYFHLGLVYEKKSEIIKCIKYYKQSIEHNASNISAILNLGNLHLKNKDFQSALNSYENASKLRSNDPNIYYNLGITWTKLNKVNYAIENYLKAIDLNSKNSLVYYNIALLYSKDFNSKYYSLGDAEINFKKAIALDPNTAKFYYNLAWIQSRLEKYDLAIENYKKSVELNNNYKNAKYNLSRLQLATENFEEGWKIYDQLRYKKFEDNLEYKKILKDILKLKKWTGEKFSGKLFVYGEQGIGDQILFSSIIPDLYKKHSDIYLTVEKRLVNLFRRSFKNITIESYENKANVSNKDLQIPLFSLGNFFRKSASNFKPCPYIYPSSEKIRYYKNILSKDKIKLGLSWRTKSDDQENKSISLEKLSKILTIKNIEFINLQYGDTLEERNKFKSEFGVELLNIDSLDLMNDFEGLSALISSCDLVLTITNATAQLAGSIGKPTWVMLHTNPHWEWFLNRSNSLWYPNIRLFRQTQQGVWDTVIENVYAELLNNINKNNLLE